MMIIRFMIFNARLTDIKFLIFNFCNNIDIQSIKDNEMKFIEIKFNRLLDWWCTKVNNQLINII